MKKVTLILVLVILLSASVFASDESGWKPSFSLSSKYLNKYVGPAGAVFHDGEVIQSSLTVSFTNGWYLNFWNSTGLRNPSCPDGASFVCDWGDEIDYTVGKTFSLYGLNVDIGVGYWDCFKLFKESENDVLFPYVEVSKDFKLDERNTISPYFKFTTLLRAPGSEIDNGTNLFWGIKHSWDANEIHIRQMFSFVRDDGSFGGKPGMIVDYQASVAYDLTKSFTWDIISFRICTPIAHSDSLKTEVILGTGATLKF